MLGASDWGPAYIVGRDSCVVYRLPPDEGPTTDDTLGRTEERCLGILQFISLLFSVCYCLTDQSRG